MKNAFVPWHLVQSCKPFKARLGSFSFRKSAAVAKHPSGVLSSELKYPANIFRPSSKLPSRIFSTPRPAPLLEPAKEVEESELVLPPVSFAFFREAQQRGYPPVAVGSLREITSRLFETHRELTRLDRTEVQRLPVQPRLPAIPACRMLGGGKGAKECKVLPRSPLPVQVHGRQVDRYSPLQ